MGGESQLTKEKDQGNPRTNREKMTEAVEMGIKSLEGRTLAMHEGLVAIEKKNAKTGQGMNNILDLVREMRQKVQHLLDMQEHIDKQFKNVDRIIIGNTADTYSEYKAPEPVKRRKEPEPVETKRKISISDDEDFVPTKSATKVTFDELSDDDQPEVVVVAAEIETVEYEPTEEGGDSDAKKAAALEEAEKLDEEFEADEEALREEEEKLEEEERAAQEELAAEEAEEAEAEALRKEEEELARLEAEEAELRRQEEEEEALRKEEEELARLEAEEAELARLEEEEARRLAEEELLRLQEEEEEAKKLEEEEAKKKAEEEAKKKSKFPPPKKAPVKLNKFQGGGKNKVVFK